MRLVKSGVALLLAALSVVSVQTSRVKSAAGDEVTTSANLRIGIIGLANDGCTQTPPPTVLEAYVAHLKTRLEKPVFLCGIKDQASAAAALAARGIDMAILDPASFAANKGTMRSILAPRFVPEEGRVLAVALTLKTSGRDSLAKLEGARPIFISSRPTGRAIPLQAMKDYGFDTARLGAEFVTTETDGYAALKAGKGDALIITAGARQRICRTIDPKGQICPDSMEVWRGRPTAPKAFVVRNDMSEADRYQLIGIHIALHKDNPGAFADLMGMFPGAVMLDPTEPGALLLVPR